MSHGFGHFLHFPRLKKPMASSHSCIDSRIFQPNLSQVLELVGGWTNPFEKYDRQIGIISINKGEKKKNIGTEFSPSKKKQSWTRLEHSFLSERLLAVLFRSYPYRVLSKPVKIT